MQVCGEERLGAPPHSICAGGLGILPIYIQTPRFLHSVFIFEWDN
jgi:hypothetical protein